ncbi:MAG: DUF1887 family protein, partial [Zetaproteobacteria bacterium]
MCICRSIFRPRRAAGSLRPKRWTASARGLKRSRCDVVNELARGVLVQNASAQCIPNLVATKTFKPQKIVWLYTPQVEGEARRMGAIAAHWRPRPEQRFCQVDARDVQALDKALARALGRLARERRPIVFHLTGGTKSMALMAWRQMRALEEKGARCYAVVMDP